MLRSVSGAICLAIFIHTPIWAQDASPVCPPAELQSAEAAPIEELVVWRGTELNRPVVVSWTDQVCAEARGVVPSEDSAFGEEPTWGVPELAEIEGMILASPAFADVTSGEPVQAEFPPVLEGTPTSGSYARGPRIVLVGESIDAAVGGPLHLRILDASATHLAVRVELVPQRPLDLEWSRSPSHPEWTAAEAVTSF